MALNFIARTIIFFFSFDIQASYDYISIPARIVDDFFGDEKLFTSSFGREPSKFLHFLTLEGLLSYKPVSYKKRVFNSRENSNRNLTD